jgi:hypothetical protein
MTEERRRALRDAGILKRLWWRLKWPWWQVKVALCPGCERRARERITAKAAEHALQASLTQMVAAFQHEEEKK